MDLVNDNYSDFLSLGSSLRGGEDRVEDVRVGLLGFERDVQGLRDMVGKERERVGALVRNKREVMREIAVGRELLEIEERVGLLEVELGLREREVIANVREEVDEGLEEGKEEWGEEWDDETPGESDEEFEDERGAISPRLRKRADQFLMVMVLMARYDGQHPFIVAEQGRIRKIRGTLLLDLDAAIRAEPDVKGKQEIMRLRGSVEE